MTDIAKPPLGLAPTWAWRDRVEAARVREIVEAIIRYRENSPPMIVPEEWLEELRYLVSKEGQKP